MPHLDPTLHQRITRFCEIGDGFAESGQYLQAIDSYLYARNLLPEPKAQWQAATWIAAAIGDAHFLAKHFKAARDVLQQALDGQFPDAADNAFIYLRLGQAEYELGHGDAALKALQRAYEIAGNAIFADEADEYMQFLADRLPGFDISV